MTSMWRNLNDDINYNNEWPELEWAIAAHALTSYVTSWMIGEDQDEKKREDLLKKDFLLKIPQYGHVHEK